ncbi:aminopeptidase N [Neptunomonas sp. XY-337]|uniref:aminopeptidase N n=1 Tax=Neptunomonas sp. XY-337 TaxID=2561897 RepID=UPI0010AA3E24|nr:aminopeptidase N [Neptunomonas sp. XY-337]
MSTTPSVIYLKDYQVPPFLIESTQLRFELEDDRTLVKAELRLTRNPECQVKPRGLLMHGDESLRLCRLAVDGQVLTAKDYSIDAGALTIAEVPDQFILESVVEIDPAKNTALEGLYLSDGVYCTQCEAEGFRRITYYLDRPDVMSVFTTTVVADKARFPVLLSNGNPVAEGDDSDGRHWVTWEDPFPKPAYLFALVAGDLKHIEDTFTTASGKQVALRLFAEEKDLDKLDHAMTSLKASMRWDEQVYGREYDLEIYMIVAVDFFNMGAMENKGLNVFNTSCVLASQKTTTDAGFQRVEAVVAHEYFHNWSGNRVTCRDWFQLSLKEGFTVFRDAEFSADMNSRTVKRVEDVQLLRTAQFSEDAGPMAHPVRPASFIEISNFYTMTVYEKGAEVVRMIHTLLGPDQFRAGSDLYFERHDGQAVTTDDFVAAMEAASGRDLTQFKRWYSQAGTPVLDITDEYDPSESVYRLRVKQACPPTPEASEKAPFHIPLQVGLLSPEGTDMPLENDATTVTLELTESEQTFTFTGIPQKPVPSLLRGFSAPVKLNYAYSQAELVFLMQHDSDGFNRWEAAQKLGVIILQALIADYQAGRELVLSDALVGAYRAVLNDTTLDPAMVAKVLTLPSQAYLGELSTQIDVDAIHAAREFAMNALACALEAEFSQAYKRCLIDVAYQPSAEQVAQRMLKNLCLSYLLRAGKPEYLALAQQQFSDADNMTDEQAALALVVHSNYQDAAQAMLSQFYSRWSQESLVVNSWLAVQASNPCPGALSQVEALMQHEAFNMKNPNKVRSLIGVFCGQNPVNFHAKDGSGYRFLADQVVALNELNPQIASRLVAPLTKWKRYDETRQQLMRDQLQRIMDSAELSRDVYEVVSKSI